MDNLDQTKSMNLPNATASLVLGVLSLSMCYCWGTVSLILAIIGFVLGNQATSIYKSNPEIYSETSYGNANSGKICCIIGIALNVVMLLWTVVRWSATMEALRTIRDMYSF